jgi:hypothetical protein
MKLGLVISGVEVIFAHKERRTLMLMNSYIQKVHRRCRHPGKDRSLGIGARRQTHRALPFPIARCRCVSAPSEFPVHVGLEVAILGMGHRPSDMGEADSDVAGDGDVEARFDHGTSWAIGTP